MSSANATATLAGVRRSRKVLEPDEDAACHRLSRPARWHHRPPLSRNNEGFTSRFGAQFVPNEPLEFAESGFGNWRWRRIHCPEQRPEFLEPGSAGLQGREFRAPRCIFLERAFQPGCFVRRGCAGQRLRCQNGEFFIRHTFSYRKKSRATCTCSGCFSKLTRSFAQARASLPATVPPGNWCLRLSSSHVMPPNV